MHTHLKRTVVKIIRAPYMIYLAIVAAGIVVYGLQLSHIGFYWDDWPWVWLLHTNGAQSLLTIDEFHRPLSGVVLYLGGLLAGENPLGWQSYTLALRILGTAALIWLLTNLWQEQRQRVYWVAFLFLLYPGFNQQFVAVNNSRHLFPLVTFLLSLGFTVKAVKSQQNALRHTFIALALSGITMLTSEYYYGLELIRPVIIWLIIRRKEKSFRPSFIAAFKYWLPYALLLTLLFGWRYNVSTRRNYSVTIFDKSGSGLLQLAQNAALDLWTATVGAWHSIFSRMTLDEYGKRIQTLYWLVVGIITGGIWLYFGSQPQTDDAKSWRTEALILGGIALVISPIPFWVTGLDPKLGFPNDRLLLPSILPASLLLVVLIDFLFKPRTLKIMIIGLIIGLSAGSHTQNALVYRNAWASTGSFFRQLSIRAPSLPANTTILSNQLPGRSTDNSLIAPLNWSYAPNFTDGTIPLQILYVDLRFGRDNPTIDESIFQSKPYMTYLFEGSVEQTLVVFYEPPACLQVITPEELLRKIPAPMDAVVQYSDPTLIDASTALNATVPDFWQKNTTQENWCDYFQRADLARQHEDWTTAAALGDAAFGAGKTPNHPSERIPFIEGYAHTGDWEKAIKITLEEKSRNTMLCAVWARIQNETPESAAKKAALHAITENLTCDFQGITLGDSQIFE